MRRRSNILSTLVTRQGFRPRHLSEKEEVERLVRAEMAALRRRLRSTGYGGPMGSSPRRANNRFAKEVSRSRLKRILTAADIRRPTRVAKDTLLARYQPSTILDRLVPDRQRGWRPVLRRLVRKSPASVRLKNFSFLTHPAETLAAFKQLAGLDQEEIKALVHFDDTYCLDAGAYLLLAEVWHSIRQVLAGGRMERPVQKVLMASGVSQHNRMALGAVDEEDLQDPEKANVWAFKLQRRRPANTSKSKTVHLDPQSREKVADDFCDEVDRWIGVPGINSELTDEGKGWMAQIIGELLCNAERHSQEGSSDGDWSTTAFMVRRLENGVPTYRCHIAFLSVGRSIAESLDDAAPDVRERLDLYCSRHRGGPCSRNTLATVFALQDTVTRDPVAHEVRSGGTGLQDVLEFVTLLGHATTAGNEPRVTLLSGASCIQMSPPHVVGTRAHAADDPRLLWFNDSNSATEWPDERFVSDLRDHLAGTLVTVAFTLDPHYFAQLTEAYHEDHQP